jgi:hypothetical protein
MLVKAVLVENSRLFACLVIFFLVEKTFSPCIGYGFCNFDDSDYVYSNPHVISGLTFPNFCWAFSSTTSGNWHPLTMLSLMLDTRLFGYHAWGYHFTNVVIHSFNTLLLFLLLESMTHELGMSLCVALLFGLHPLRVESVVWVSERKDVLSVFFGFLTMLAYVKYTAAAGLKGAKTREYYGLALLAFILGLMAKPMLVTIPCVMLLLDVWPLKRLNGTSLFTLIKEKVPFFLLSGIISVCTFSTQGPTPLREVQPHERLETMFLGYSRYLGKIVYPADLSLFYPYPVHWPVIPVILAALLLVIISVMVAEEWKRRQYVVIGWCWFLGTLFPVIGLMQTGHQSMADRYSYLPSIGILIILVWYGCEIAKQAGLSTWVLRVATAGLVLMCCGLTRHQIYYWRSNDTLWQHAAAVTEKNYVAYGLIGFSYLQSTNYDAAITNFQASLAVRDDQINVCNGLAEALAKSDRSDEAVVLLKKAISRNRSNATLRRQMALVLAAQGHREEAITNFLYALKLKPDYLEARADLNRLTNSVSPAPPPPKTAPALNPGK